MYQTNRMINTNKEEADTSNLLETRHNPAASVIGDFHNTAHSLGRIFQWHGHSAIMGVLEHARDEIQSGSTLKSLNLPVPQEQMSTLSGRNIMEAMHGNSASSRMIIGMAAAAGPPSTFTNLPLNENYSIPVTFHLRIGIIA